MYEGGHAVVSAVGELCLMLEGLSETMRSLSARLDAVSQQRYRRVELRCVVHDEVIGSISEGCEFCGWSPLYRDERTGYWWVWQPGFELRKGPYLHERNAVLVARYWWS